MFLENIYRIFGISGILAFPLELFVKAIPKVLFSHFKKINEFDAKVIFIVLDTISSMIMSLLCMNDVVENKD